MAAHRSRESMLSPWHFTGRTKSKQRTHCLCLGQGAWLHYVLRKGFRLRTSSVHVEIVQPGHTPVFQIFYVFECVLLSTQRCDVRKYEQIEDDIEILS